MILIICPLLLLFLASDGCLQYFTGVSGQMFSFNYNDATVRSTKIFVLLFLLHFIYILVMNRFCPSHALFRASSCPTRTTRCVSEWKGTSVGSSILPVLIQVCVFEFMFAFVFVFGLVLVFVGSNTLPVLIQVLSVAWWFFGSYFTYSFFCSVIFVQMLHKICFIVFLSSANSPAQSFSVTGGSPALGSVVGTSVLNKYN